MWVHFEQIFVQWSLGGGFLFILDVQFLAIYRKYYPFFIKLPLNLCQETILMWVYSDSILLHWPTCLFLCQYHTVFISIGYNKS